MGCGGSTASGSKTERIASTNFVTKGVDGSKIFFPTTKNNSHALLIVNTYQLPNALNDVLVQIPMLLNWGVPIENINILVDTTSDSRLNLLSNLSIDSKSLRIITNRGVDFLSKYNSLLQEINTKSGGLPANLYIFVSGHGSRLRDSSGDEADGYDEFISPNGVTILDDLLYNGLTYLDSNFLIACGTDTCHSGTMFDLDKDIKKLKANYFSIAACADDELDWEIGCDTTSSVNYLKDIPNTQQYIAYLQRSTYITGALTSAVIEYAFNGFNNNSLMSIQTKLTSINQSVIVSNSPGVRNIITDGASTGVTWVIVIFVILIILVLIFIFLYINVRKNVDPKFARADYYMGR